IHRDLKPANIFLVQPKNALPLIKVLDFGIAKLAADAVDDPEQNNLTQTGVMIGTPRYMSPEQCDGAHLTPAADVYSLGIILYEMLTGVTPFTGPSPLAVALQHSSKPPRRPTELIASIPLELERLVLHALEKNPLNRPPNAGAFRRDLVATAKLAGIDPTLAYLVTNEVENGNGAQPTGRYMLSAETSGGQRSNVKTYETTVLADTSEKVRPQTGKVFAAPPTAALAAGVSPTPQPEHPFTRIKILLRGSPTWLYWLKQPPVVLAIALTLLVVVIGVTAFVRTRSGEAIPVENANFALSPSPEPTPTPSPAPDNTTNGKAQQSGSKPTRRVSRSNNNKATEKKGSKVGGAFRKLKRILNPF
ncbi:MAG: serine/threonine protein kinase, partial [Acidobacteria bacterium]|nr:serine/threonine protein kinase [Acidobacteriota bacterium]